MAWGLRPLAGWELGEEGERSEGELGPRQGLNLSGRLPQKPATHRTPDLEGVARPGAARAASAYGKGREEGRTKETPAGLSFLLLSPAHLLSLSQAI